MSFFQRENRESWRFVLISAIYCCSVANAYSILLETSNCCYSILLQYIHRTIKSTLLTVLTLLRSILTVHTRGHLTRCILCCVQQHYFHCYRDLFTDHCRCCYYQLHCCPGIIIVIIDRLQYVKILLSHYTDGVIILTSL